MALWLVEDDWSRRKYVIADSASDAIDLVDAEIELEQIEMEAKDDTEPKPQQVPTVIDVSLVADKVLGVVAAMGGE